MPCTAAALLAGTLLIDAGSFAVAGPDGPGGSGAPAAPGSTEPASGPASAAAPDAVPERPVDGDTLELMRVSGIDEEIERLAADLAAAMTSGFAAADTSGSIDRVRIAARVGAPLFSVERVHDVVARRVQAMLDEPARAALIRHHTSALGRRTLAAERHRSAEADPEAIQRFVEEAGRGAGFDARLDRLASLMTETGADELVAHLASDLQRVTMAGELVADPAGRGGDIDERIGELEWQRGIVRFMLAREMPALMAHTYATLSDEDLAALLAASRDGGQRRLLEALRAGLHDAVLAGTADFGSRFRAALRKEGVSGVARDGADPAGDARGDGTRALAEDVRAAD